MIMTRLAFSSLRRRTTGFVASFVTMLFGATILMTFASLLDTRMTPGVDSRTGQTLVMMASVVGGWGLVIVLFAGFSTLSLLLRQRAAEMALLKSAGATPTQISRMVVGEAAIVAVFAAAAAIAPSVFTGRWLVSLLAEVGRVPAGLDAAFGPIAISMGTGITLIAALAAAMAAARRAALKGIRETGVDTRPIGRLQVFVASAVLAAGIGCGVVTMTVFTGEEPALMAIGGQGAILTAIGLALLSPALLGPIAAVLATPLRRLGVSGLLTATHLRVRSRQLAGVLVPIILFTGIATGTLYMQEIENAAGAMPAAVAGTIETLNYVVVGMIALFTAVMLVNTIVAAIIGRRREFGQLRLIGSTPSQVLRLVGTEGGVLVVTGILFGSLAAAVTVVPYSVARTGRVLPDLTIGLYLAVAAVAVLLTFASHLGAAAKAMRTAAIQAGTGG